MADYRPDDEGVSDTQASGQEVVVDTHYYPPRATSLFSQDEVEGLPDDLREVATQINNSVARVAAGQTHVDASGSGVSLRGHLVLVPRTDEACLPKGASTESFQSYLMLTEDFSYVPADGRLVRKSEDEQVLELNVFAKVPLTPERKSELEEAARRRASTGAQAGRGAGVAPSSGDASSRAGPSTDVAPNRKWDTIPIAGDYIELRRGQLVLFYTSTTYSSGLKQPGGGFELIPHLNPVILRGVQAVRTLSATGARQSFTSPSASQNASSASSANSGVEAARLLVPRVSVFIKSIEMCGEALPPRQLLYKLRGFDFNMLHFGVPDWGQLAEKLRLLDEERRNESSRTQGAPRQTAPIATEVSDESVFTDMSQRQYTQGGGGSSNGPTVAFPEVDDADTPFVTTKRPASPLADSQASQPCKSLVPYNSGGDGTQYGGGAGGAALNASNGILATYPQLSIITKYVSGARVGQAEYAEAAAVSRIDMLESTIEGHLRAQFMNLSLMPMASSKELGRDPLALLRMDHALIFSEIFPEKERNYVIEFKDTKKPRLPVYRCRRGIVCVDRNEPTAWARSDAWRITMRLLEIASILGITDLKHWEAIGPYHMHNQKYAVMAVRPSLGRTFMDSRQNSGVQGKGMEVEAYVNFALNDMARYVVEHCLPITEDSAKRLTRAHLINRSSSKFKDLDKLPFFNQNQLQSPKHNPFNLMDFGVVNVLESTAYKMRDLTETHDFYAMANIPPLSSEQWRVLTELGWHKACEMCSLLVDETPGTVEPEWERISREKRGSREYSDFLARTKVQLPDRKTGTVCVVYAVLKELSKEFCPMFNVRASSAPKSTPTTPVTKPPASVPSSAAAVSKTPAHASTPAPASSKAPEARGQTVADERSPVEGSGAKGDAYLVPDEENDDEDDDPLRLGGSGAVLKTPHIRAIEASDPGGATSGTDEESEHGGTSDSGAPPKKAGKRRGRAINDPSRLQKRSRHSVTPASRFMPPTDAD